MQFSTFVVELMSVNWARVNSFEKILPDKLPGKDHIKSKSDSLKSSIKIPIISQTKSKKTIENPSSSQSPYPFQRHNLLHGNEYTSTKNFIDALYTDDPDNYVCASRRTSSLRFIDPGRSPGARAAQAISCWCRRWLSSRPCMHIFFW